MRIPGASLAPAAQSPLMEQIAKMRKQKDLCDKFLKGLSVPSNWEVPDSATVKKMIENAKKLEGVFALATKAAIAAEAVRDV